MNESQDLVAVQVDDEVCIGAGQCEMLEEETFLIDDDTAIAKVIGSGQLPRDRAESIIERCPSGAISIADAASDVRSPVEEPSGDGSGPAAKKKEEG